MATITATSSASLLARAALANTRAGVSSSPVLGLPSLAKKGKIVCFSMEVKASNKESNSSMGASAAWLTTAAATTMSSPAMALVDERMSTEGTGLPFGLSNNLLGWLLVGVFALIWSLYFVYTSGLEEDEESGLSL